jgi:acyl-CoA synthetase (AMP-forming)/AMP-acid ligase II
LKGQNTVANSFENKSGIVEIALFVEGILTDTGIIAGYLKSKLPYYMVPTRILVIKSFPLNSNGKIDRKLLKNLILI